MSVVGLGSSANSDLLAAFRDRRTASNPTSFVAQLSVRNPPAIKSTAVDFAACIPISHSEKPHVPVNEGPFNVRVPTDLSRITHSIQSGDINRARSAYLQMFQREATADMEPSTNMKTAWEMGEPGIIKSPYDTGSGS